MNVARSSPVAIALYTGIFTSAACSSSSGSGAAAGGPQQDSGAAAEQIVVVEGKLAQPAAQAQATHDMIFGGFRSQAASLGNIGHAVFLDASTSTSILAVDTWDNPAGLQSFLMNPDVQKADQQLFAGPPTLNVTTLRSGWYGWGTFTRTLPDGKPAYVALIRGTLASDPQTSMGIHNQGAQQAQAQVQPAGDQAHVVLEDASDPQAFLVIDVWSNATAPASVYGSPDFQKGFAALLTGAPTVTLYARQTWVQWP